MKIQTNVKAGVDIILNVKTSTKVEATTDVAFSYKA
jgi:hypothetical protein